MMTPLTTAIAVVQMPNGVCLPQISIGTAGLASAQGEVPSNPSFTDFLPESTSRVVQLALEAGIRHIDTALIYRSHRQIAQVLGSWFASGTLCRSDIFLKSKIYHPCTTVATRGTTLDLEGMTSQELVRATAAQFEQSLEELGVGYVDCMLLHWPAAGGGVGAIEGSLAGDPEYLNILSI